MKAPLLSQLLVLTALAAAPRAGDVSLFVGDPGGVGGVWILGSDPGALPTLPPELQGIRLLSFDVTGRTPLSELLDSSPRLRLDVPGAARVVLPQVGSSLYRYRRDFADGSAVFGFFLIDGSGQALPLGALPGGGVMNHVDPLAGRLAVSPEGDALLLATKPAAGGDLYEMDLTTGAWIVRTEGLPPQTFHLDSLCLLDTWGAALSEAGLVRFDRQPGGQATLVPFTSGQPAWTGDEIVCSADQSTIAFAAGDGPTAAWVHVAGPAGPVERASSQPQALLGGGFLPTTAAGPHLALSIDGSRVAWVAQLGGDRECFSRPTPNLAPAPAPEVHVTADANFQDTLNDSGVISFFSPDELVLVAGEADGAAIPGIEEADVFCVDFTTDPPTYTNLTASKGSTQPPFDYGRLSTEDGILRIPGTSELLLLDPGDDPVPGSLLRLDVATGALGVVLDEVRRIEWTEHVGRGLLLTVRRSGLGNRHNLLEVGPVDSTVLLESAPDFELSRSAVRPGTGTLAAVLRNETGGEFLGRIHPNGSGGLLVPLPLAFGPTVGFAAGGDVVASLPTQNGAVFLRWPEGGVPEPLWPTELSGFLLPGN